MKTTSALRAAVIALAAIMLTTAPALAVSEASVLRMLKSPAKGDATLGALMGKWRGRGQVRLGSDGAPEAAQCRFTNRWAADGKLAHLLLACRGTDVRFTAEGFLGRSKGRYLGAWSATGGRKATMSGRRAGSGLRLTITATGADRAKAPKSTLNLRISKKRITARLTTRDTKTGKTFTAFETTLKR